MSNLTSQEKVETIHNQEDIIETENFNNAKDRRSNETLTKLLEDNSNSTKETNEIKVSKLPRKIQLIENQEEYNVIKDLNKAKCDITFGQLLNASPKIRSQVSQGLRLEKNKTKITGAIDNIIATSIMVNNIDHTYVSKNNEITEDDIAMVDASVDGVPGKLLIDSCSNLSIITKKYLDKLPKEYETLGISCGRIRLATKNDDYSEGVVIKVPVKIKDFNMIVNFRVVDKEDPFYDMLINLKTQHDYKLFIHPILNSLCQFTPDCLIKEIAPINNNYEKVVLATKSNNEEKDNMLSNVIRDFIQEKFTTIDGIDYFIDGNTYRKLVTDVNEKLKLILEAHKVGHEGYYKTYQRLRKSYYWNDMVNDIKRIISKCEKCQLNRPQPYPEPTENIPTKVEGPFTHLGLDIIGPLVKTKRNNQYIMVIVDYFTKWVEAEPTENITSQDVIRFLINVFARHGTPQIITTDNGVQFSSDMTKVFLDLYDVYVKFVTTYHPESNGLTENRNKEIGKLLRLLGENNKDWDEVLPSALWALRTTKNTVTKHSSFELVYGREDQQPFDIAARPSTSIKKSSDEILLEKFINHYRWTMEACDNIKTANKYWAARREEKQSMKRSNEIHVGDLVLIRNFNRTKLEPYFVGPMKVIKKQYNTVTLAEPNSGIQMNRNVHLKNIVKFNSASV